MLLIVRESALFCHRFFWRKVLLRICMQAHILVLQQFSATHPVMLASLLHAYDTAVMGYLRLNIISIVVIILLYIKER